MFSLFLSLSDERTKGITREKEKAREREREKECGNGKENGMRTNRHGIPIQRSNNGRIRSVPQASLFVGGIPTTLFATVNLIAICLSNKISARHMCIPYEHRPHLHISLRDSASPYLTAICRTAMWHHYSIAPSFSSFFCTATPTFV